MADIATEAKMEHDLTRVFKSIQLPEPQKTLARRAGLELHRANIHTMSELLNLCEGGQDKLLEIRNIGNKRAAVILEICKIYQKEND